MKYLAFFSGLLIGFMILGAYVFYPQRMEPFVYIVGILAACSLCGWSLNMHEKERKR